VYLALPQRFFRRPSSDLHLERSSKSRLAKQKSIDNAVFNCLLIVFFLFMLPYVMYVLQLCIIVDFVLLFADNIQ